MNKVTWLLCVIVVIALALPYCGGIRVKKIDGIERFPVGGGAVSSWRHKGEQEDGKQREGHHWGGNKEGHDGNNEENGGHHMGGNKEEHHWEEQKGGDGNERHHWGDNEGHGHHRGGNKDGHREGHHWEHKEGGHHKGGHKEGHHWGHKEHHWGNMREYFRNKYSNITVHFVEESLPPHVYVVLADKGIEVKASYETSGNATSITKVGVRVADKNLILSANGNLELDGVQKNITEFDTAEFENGSIKKERCGKLVVTYGPYQIFMKARRSFEHEDESTSSTTPYIRLMVGVLKSAKVTPFGFVGARIAVDPASYISPENIV